MSFSKALQLNKPRNVFFKRILTGEKDSRLTLDINSDLLWRSLSYWELHKIPKIFLFDAAKFPSTYKTTKNGKLFLADPISVIKIYLLLLL